MVKMRKDPVATIYIRLQRDMDELLTTIARHWRFNFAPNEDLKDPLWDTHRRDLVEILLTWVFYSHKTTKDAKAAAPREVLTRPFMYDALKAQKIEQFHHLELDVESRQQMLRYSKEETEPLSVIYAKKMAYLEMFILEHQQGFRRSKVSREGDEPTPEEIEFIKKHDAMQRESNERDGTWIGPFAGAIPDDEE